MTTQNESYTSRTGLGVGNLENIYKPRPTPSESTELPVYLNDELQALGGRMNNILQGGVFPPVSEVPKRNKEGVCLLFTQPVPGPNKGDAPIIPAAGLYIYFKGKWNQITLTPVN